MNKADTGYKMSLARVFEEAFRTDGRTDTPSYRDARRHLKTDSAFVSLGALVIKWSNVNACIAK